LQAAQAPRRGGQGARRLRLPAGPQPEGPPAVGRRHRADRSCAAHGGTAAGAA